MPLAIAQRLVRAAAILAVAGGIGWGSPQLAAAQSSGAQRGVYHQVGQGETLDDIARRYRVSAYEIARANRLQANARPAPGTRVFVPGATGASAPAARTSGPAASGAARQPGAARTPAPASPSAARPPHSSGSGVHSVQPGESLWVLARRHGLTVRELADANSLNSNAALQVGQQLVIPSAGSTNSSASGSAGNDRTVRPPAGSPASQGSARNSAASSGARYLWPVEGAILQRFEQRSDRKSFGIDIAVPEGTEVVAARAGTVVYSGNSISAYGNMVIVDHGDGWATCYAFNRRNLVRVDERVRQGQVIALSGDSGKRSKPYLHFQMRRNGTAVDPAPHLPR